MEISEAELRVSDAKGQYKNILEILEGWGGEGALKLKKKTICYSYGYLMEQYLRAEKRVSFGCAPCSQFDIN